MSDQSAGSTWGKWDLHVHTPASFQWGDGKHFGRMTDDEKNKRVEQIVDVMNKSDVRAFAVMDYWTFDGFFALRKARKSLKEAVFPGIERRVGSATT